MVSYQSYQTRIGQFDVHCPLGDMQLYYNGAAIVGGTIWSLSIRGAWGLAGADENWLPITGHSGGNACDPPYFAFCVSAKGLHVSPPIAGCVGELTDLRVNPDRIEIGAPHPDGALPVKL